MSGMLSKEAVDRGLSIMNGAAAAVGGGVHLHLQQPKKKKQLASSQQFQWVTFTPSMLETLSPGNYGLRQKVTVTPIVPGLENCSLEDQQLFGQVDDMERNLLDGVIQSKIRDLNKDKVKIVVSSKGTSAGTREQTLIIMDNRLFGEKQKKLGKSLGELLQMAYEQIKIPIPTVTVKEEEPSTSTSGQNDTKMAGDAIITLRDHNYWGLKYPQNY